MARRMFSPKITNTDSFLDMPVSARELYFQLGMNADDDGFITPKKVIRMIGASEDDLKILVAKNFVIPFESGVIVITAWKVNNLIRKDWYQETIYREEKRMLTVADNGEYLLIRRKIISPKTRGELENVNEMLTSSLTQVRLGKVRLGKVIKKKVIKKKLSLNEIGEPEIKSISEKLTEKFGVKVTEAFVRSKLDDLQNYCKRSGRTYKDYIAALENFCKGDILKGRGVNNVERQRVAVISPDPDWNS